MDDLAIGAEVLISGEFFDITNSMTTGLLVTIAIILLAITVNSSLKINETPSKFQLVIEILINGMYSFVEQIAGNAKIAKKIFPIVGSVFLYIGISNILLILIPGIGALVYGDQEISLFRAHTADFSTTFGLSVAVVLWSHFSSIRRTNIFVHINKYIRIGSIYKGFKEGIGAGLLSFIDFFVGLLDIVSEFAKSISLSLRLFGNMFAGELLAFIVIGAIPVGAPSLLILMALFTGIIQSVVFGALTSSYFGSALSD